MNSDDRYELIYELVEGDFLHNVLKHGTRFNDDVVPDVFLYVDIDDFAEFNFTLEEEELLIDCLHQKGIEVYDSYGQEYANYQQIDEIMKVNYDREKRLSLKEKISKYRKERDRELRNELVEDNMDIVKKAARKIAEEYRLPYDDLVQTGYEYLIYIIEEYDLTMIDEFFHYVYMRMMKHVIRKAISMFDYGDMDKKIIRDYLDAKKNVEHVYGQTVAENPALMDEIIDLIVEEQGLGENIFEHAESLLDLRRVVGPREYNQALSKEFRKTEAGREYRRVVNANVAPMGIEEFLSQYEISYEDGNTLFDKTELMNALNSAISELGERDQKIIRMRFGLDGKVYSLSEIGVKMGRTREAIRLREEKSLKKLNAILRETITREVLLDYLASIDEEKDWEEEISKPKKR